MTRLTTLRRARSKQANDLYGLPNVLGTGLGLKRRSGERVSNSAVIIYVRNKVPPDALDPSERLPSEIRFGDDTIPTDVVEIAGMRREFANPPYFISDRMKKGTMTAFASADGRLHAVSCAHCLRGRDGNPHTTEPIDFWDAGSNRYIQGGENGFAVDAPGLGIPGNFGFSDAGLVALEHPQLVRRARAAPQMRPVTRIVRGLAVASQGPNADISGTIDAVEAVIDRTRIDLVVFMPNGGTVPGNSGMLWRTNNGDAVGIHAIGAFTDNAAESRYSLCMSAARLISTLQIELLDPGWRP